MAQGLQRREVLIRVATDGLPGLKQLSSYLGNLNKNVNVLAGGFSFLRNAALGYFSILQVGTVARFSDEIQQLNDRIAVLSGGQDNARDILGGLNDVARRTKTSLEGISTVYSRLAASTKNYTLSQSVLLRATELLQNTFRLSGATAQEATAVAIQLSQGLAAGAVRGQELRSVLEQNVFLAQVLRKEYGNNIFKLAEKDIIKGTEVFRLLFREQENINNQARQLSQTFGQTLTVALNDLKLAIFDINKELGLNQKFADFIDLLTKKIGLLALAFTALAASIFLTSKAATSAVFAKILIGGAKLLSLMNPLTLAVAGLGVILVSTFEDFDEFSDFLDRAIKKTKEFLGIRELVRERPTQDLGLFAGAEKERREREKFLAEIDRNRRRQDRQGVVYGPSREEFDVQKFQGALKKATGEVKTVKEEFADLNKEFLKGRMALSDYFASADELRLKKLVQDLNKGSIAFDKFSEQQAELEKRNLTRLFNQGTIAASTFDEAISNIQLDQLNLKLQSGSINAREFESELIKISKVFDAGGALRVGTNDYLTSVGTASQQVADLIKDTFKSLEDAIFQATKTGKLNFSDFAQSVLDDLTRIIIRTQILTPIAQGLPGLASGFAGLFSGPASGGGSVPQLLSPNIEPYAKGGVVSGATLFSYGSSMKVGMAGEAGPEAILPLSRGPGGELGVSATQSPVNVTVINNASADVSTRETVGPGGDRVLEILIENKLREGIAKGSFDKSFNAAYGIRRRGN